MAFDTYYSDIWLLLRLNGSDGATSFPDSSMFPKTATAYGSVQIDTAYSAYGGASALFNGSTDYLKYGDTADCKFLHDGTAFTLEFQAKVTHTGSTQVVMDSTASTAAGITIFRNASTGQLIFYMRNAAGTNILDGGNLGVMMDDGDFHHYRFTFDPSLLSDQLKLAIDSVFSGSSDITGVASTGVAGNPLHIGTNYGLSQFFTGHLDDIRITKGVVRDPSGFTVEESGDLAPSTGEADIMGLVGLVSGRGGFGLRAVYPLDKLGLKFLGAGLMHLTAPSPVVIARGAGRLAVQQIKPWITFSGRPGAENFFLPITAPMPAIVARGGGRLVVDGPKPVIQIAGTVVSFGRMAVVAPVAVVMATGQGAHFGRIVAKAPAPLVSARGGARLSVVAPFGAVVASGTPGSLARLHVIAPAPIVNFSGRFVNHGNLHVVAPMGRIVHGARLQVRAPVASVFASGGPVVAVVYEAYSINLEMADKAGIVYAASRYTNFPFEQILRWKGDYYGIAADGVYLLGGTTDHATPDPMPIPYAWKTLSTDDDSPQKKTVVSAVFGGRMGAQSAVQLFAGDDEPREYEYKVQREAVARNYRQKFGRGIKARYFAVGSSGEEEIELSTLDLEIQELTRKV